MTTVYGGGQSLLLTSLTKTFSVESSSPQPPPLVLLGAGHQLSSVSTAKVNRLRTGNGLKSPEEGLLPLGEDLLGVVSDGLFIKEASLNAAEDEGVQRVNELSLVIQLNGGLLVELRWRG
ncbi:hypothetical protein TYRP_005350 [Tyrophagus putrescentiae]|nr:hypothetical protein TYRP_005350 [Tyrophagus putrescentiae]